METVVEWFTVAILGLLTFLGVLFVHELGHFVAARVANIFVREFSIGIGPIVWARWWGHTRFAVRLAPLFAYIAPACQNDEEWIEPELARGPPGRNTSFTTATFLDHASWIGRMCYIGAGPLANFAFAWMLGVGIFMLPVQYEVTNEGVRKVLISGAELGWSERTIAERATDFRVVVQESSGCLTHHMRPGDVILAVGNDPVRSLSDWDEKMSNRWEGQITLSVKRDGLQQELKFSLTDPETPCDGTEWYTLRAFASVGMHPLEAMLTTTTITYTLAMKSPGMLKDMLIDMVSTPIDSADGAQTAITIVPELGRAWTRGLRETLIQIAWFSVGLGLVNLLPIPPLDGGKIVGLFLELIIPARISRKQFTIRLNKEHDGEVVSLQMIVTGVFTVIFLAWFLLAILLDVYDMV